MEIATISPTTLPPILSGSPINRSISALNTFGGDERTKTARPGAPVDIFFPPGLISEEAAVISGQRALRSGKPLRCQSAVGCYLFPSVVYPSVKPEDGRSGVYPPGGLSRDQCNRLQL